VKRDNTNTTFALKLYGKRWNGYTHIHPWLVQLLESCLDNMIATLLVVSLGHSSELALASAPCRMDGVWMKNSFFIVFSSISLCTQHPHVSTYLIFIMCLTYLPIYMGTTYLPYLLTTIFTHLHP
jgi:hypothetical protein